MYCVYCASSSEYAGYHDETLNLNLLEYLFPDEKSAMDYIRAKKASFEPKRKHKILVRRNWYATSEDIEDTAAKAS